MGARPGRGGAVLECAWCGTVDELSTLVKRHFFTADLWILECHIGVDFVFGGVRGRYADGPVDVWSVGWDDAGFGDGMG